MVTQTLVIQTLTKDQAEELTHKIKESKDALWDLLWRAKDGEAWRVLGYRSWETYVQSEFDIGRNYANKIVHQGFVIHKLAAAAGVGTVVPVITEHQARQISFYELPKVAASVRESVQSGTEPQEAVKVAVGEAVEKQTRRRVDSRPSLRDGELRDSFRSIEGINSSTRKIKQCWGTGKGRKFGEALRALSAHHSSDEISMLVTRLKDNVKVLTAVLTELESGIVEHADPGEESND